MGEVRGALLGGPTSTYDFDDRLRRYILTSEAVPRVLAEIRGERNAEERYRELFLTTWDDVARLVLDRLMLSPDPDAVRGVSLVVWNRTRHLTPLALRVLGRIGTPAAVEIVLDSLDDSSVAIATAAVHAAARVERDKTRAALRAVAEDGRPGVSRAARVALQQQEGPE
jgi:HEAT repeat protein